MMQDRSRQNQPRGSSHASLQARALGWSALLLPLLLVLVACGGDDGDTETAAAADPTAAPAATADGAAAESMDDTPSDGAADGIPDAIADLASETGSAIVTIGDETFEFSLAGTRTIDGTTYIGRCESLFGMIVGGGYAADGRDITLDLEIPPVDWATYEDDRFDPPAIEVEDNEGNASWVADEAYGTDGGSGVGEYEQSETTASGSATFMNQWVSESEPVEGTFEVDCGT